MSPDGASTRITFVDALPDDAALLDAAVAVERAAFGGEEEAQLVRDLLADSTAQPLLSLLAFEGPDAVGHILFTAAGVQGTDLNAAILAPLAVVPAYQKRGVGGALIEEGVARLAAAGVDLVFVLGHPSYYPRHGFVPAIPLDLTVKYPIDPPEAWMVRTLRDGLLGQVGGHVTFAKELDRPELWRE